VYPDKPSVDAYTSSTIPPPFTQPYNQPLNPFNQNPQHQLPNIPLPFSNQSKPAASEAFNFSLDQVPNF